MIGNVSDAFYDARVFFDRNYRNATSLFSNIRDRVQSIFRQRQENLPGQVVATASHDNIPISVISIGDENQNLRVTDVISENNSPNESVIRFRLSRLSPRGSQEQDRMYEVALSIRELDLCNLSQSTAPATDNSHD